MTMGKIFPLPFYIRNIQVNHVPKLNKKIIKTIQTFIV